MDKNFKRMLLLITYGVCLYLFLSNLKPVLAFVPYVLNMFVPIFVGIIIAFVLNVPLKIIETNLAKFTKLNKKQQRILSLLCSILVIIIIFIAAICFVIPEFISSLLKLIPVIQQKLPLIFENLDSIGIDVQMLNVKINEIINSFMHFDIQSIFSLVTEFAYDIFGSIVGVATSTANILANFLMSFIIAVYILIDKEGINRRVVKLLYATCNVRVANYLCRIGNLINETYFKFFSGQCIEAIILGSLIFVALTIFGIPYASLTAILTGLLSFIPYIGAFLSCGIGVLLVLLISPIKAIICLIVYQTVQFIENQFIYPRVVGGSVGLSPLLTLIAVLVGGKLFGAVGMIFFIPLTSVIYTIAREFVNQQLANKHVTLK